MPGLPSGRARPSPRGARKPSAPALSNLGLRRASSSTAAVSGAVRKTTSVAARKKQKSPKKEREVILKVGEAVWSGAELAGAVRAPFLPLPPWQAAR